MNTTQRGNVTELEVQLALTRLQYPVYTPVMDGGTVDLITIMDDNTCKIQVKTASVVDGGFTFGLARIYKGKRILYLDGEIDAFCTVFGNELYMVPYSLCIDKQSFTLRTKPLIKNNQYKPYYAKDFLVN